MKTTIESPESSRPKYTKFLFIPDLTYVDLKELEELSNTRDKIPEGNFWVCHYVSASLRRKIMGALEKHNHGFITGYGIEMDESLLGAEDFREYRLQWIDWLIDQYINSEIRHEN